MMPFRFVAALIIVLAAGPACAFCVYNETTNASFLVYQGPDDKTHNSKEFQVVPLNPGNNNCCNWQNRDCNKIGGQTAPVFFKLLSANATYVSGDSTNSHDCSDDDGKGTVSYPKIEAGGYLKLKNNPSFNPSAKVNHNNPHFIVLAFGVNDKQTGKWTCPGVLPGLFWGTDSQASKNQSMSLRGLAGKCLDAAWLAGQRQAGKGSRVQLQDCNGNANQKWTFANGRVESAVAGQCLAVDQGKIESGRQLLLWDCHTGNDERWESRYGQLALSTTQLCADVKEERNANGTPIILFACGPQGSKANQQWIPVH